MKVGICKIELIFCKKPTKKKPLGERWKNSYEDRRVLPIAVLDFVTFQLFSDRRLHWLLETVAGSLTESYFEAILVQ